MSWGNCMGSSEIKGFSAWLPHTSVATLCCRNATKTVLSWHSTAAINKDTYKYLIQRYFFLFFFFTGIIHGCCKYKVESSPKVAYLTFKSVLSQFPTPYSSPSTCITAHAPRSSTKSSPADN